jgi:large subunit ribosomal protein L9
MALEVLLMADVKDVGAQGDVVRVADGFARNYLFPRKLAAPVTEATRRRLARLQKDRHAELEAERQTARETAAKIEGSSYTIAVKVGTEDKMFGSVTSADVAGVLKEHGIEVDKHKIVMDVPFKELGVYEVKVKLHPEVEATMKVWIVEE